MKIYTRFDPDRPLVMRLWVLSWAARGWEPRILLSGEDDTGKYCAPVDIINFSLKPPKKKGLLLTAAQFGGSYWQQCPLVYFPDAKTDEDILACGRPLNL